MKQKNINNKKNKIISGGIFKRNKKVNILGFLLGKKRVKKNQINKQYSINKLDEFLEQTENKKRNRSVLGWQFSVLKVASKFKDIIGGIFVFIFRTIKVVIYNSTLASLLIAVIFLVSPLISAAPQSKTISSQMEWESGEIFNISTTSKTDSIQLSSSGTWTARSWAPAYDTIAYGSTSVVVGNYLYLVRGYSDKDLYVYNIDLNEWVKTIDMPQPAFYGADVAYNGVDKLYFIFGGYSKEFYSYDIETDEWEKLPNLLDSVYQGAGIEFDGADFFITRGQNSTDFWKFDISENSWYNLAPAPANIYTGGGLVYGDNRKMYVLRGYNQKTLWEYDIDNNSWNALADSPLSFNGEKKGVYRDGYVYFLRSGNTNTFYRYCIDTDSWDTLEDTPLTTNYSSIAYDTDNDKFFVIRGNGSYTFWKFDPAEGSSGDWVGPADAPSSFNTGGGLIWNGIVGAGNYLYGIKGDNNNAFYRYDVSANSWSVMSSLPLNMNYDTKGTYHNGYIYIPRGDNTTGNFYRYDIASDSWSSMSAAPGTLGQGANAVYNASDGFIYVLRGNAQRSFYRYDIAGDSWTQMADVATDDFYYYPYVGARLISDGTNLYTTVGDGETAFLKYDTATNSWSKLEKTPFAQYYGTDLTFDENGKILALAGNYQNSTWEYTIATDSWRELPFNQKYSYGRGTWAGASIAYTGNNSFYASPGTDITDFWSYTAGTTNFTLNGTFTSEVLDLGYVDSWISLTASEDIPINTSVVYQTRSSDDAITWSVWTAISGTDIQSPKKRYLQVKVTLVSSDGEKTPTIDDITISYNSEDVDPINPTTISASSARIGGESLVSSTEYKHTHPFFSWTEASDAGSQIEGYFVYFGPDSSADPETEGVFQTATSYSANIAMTTGDYYLLLKTKDNDGNITDEVWEAFVYSYDGVSPFQTEIQTSQADFEEGEVENISTSAEPDELQLEAVDGFWQQTLLSNAPGTIQRGAELVHVDGKLYSLRGYNQKSFYVYDIETDTWSSLKDAPEAVYYGGTLAEGPEGYLFASRGTNTSTFWRYDIVNDNWESVSSAPKNFTYGSSLSSDGGRYIYAFPGNDDVFYRYDTQDNRWTTLSNAEFGNPNESDGQRVYAGADAVFDGENYIYALQGNYYPYFSKYIIDDDIETGEDGNSWVPLAKAPIGVYYGGCVSYDDETNSIFMLSGNWRDNFMKYDVTTDSWMQLPKIPNSIAYGTTMKVVDGYVYVLRANGSTLFYRFNIEENSWEIPQRGFFGPSILDSTNSYFDYYYGSELVEDGAGSLYITRGYYSSDFGKYDTNSGEFLKLADTPVGLWSGTAMAYNEDENAIYLSTGTGTRSRAIDGSNNYFMRYEVATNTWETITTDPIPLQTSSGSSMTYDGARYIYLTRGASSNWWRYDTQATAGSRWSSALPTTSGLTNNYGGKILYKEVGDVPYIYWTRGGNYSTMWRYDVNSGSWETRTSAPAAINYGGSLVDTRDGYLHAMRGNNTRENFRYNITADSWEELEDVPSRVYREGDAVFSNDRIWLTARGESDSYRNGLYSYVVGSAENDTGFKKTGNYTSESIDLIDVYKWANLTARYILPNNTSAVIYTRTSSDEVEWSSWERVTNEQIPSPNEHRFNILSGENRYIQIRIEFTSSDRIKSPLLEDIEINYYQDSIAPTNPTSVVGYNNSSSGVILTSNAWYGNIAPYFVWPAAEEVNGASDGSGGSGVVGYYVYFGTDSSADPYLEGNLQSENTFTAENLSSGEDYYLRIKAIDDAEMVPASTYAAFTYRFDNTSPTNPTNILVNPAGYTASDNYTFTWESDVTDAHSGVAKFQYQTDGDEKDVWYDIDDPMATTLTLPNDEHTVAAYQSGKNWFHLRVVDAAGNVSAAINQEYYFSSSAPSPPRNLTVTPETSTINSFAFQWDQPESYMGDANKIKYVYSVNALPNAYNIINTAVRAAGPGPFATQKGLNRFYVCAMDEAENIDYDLYAYVDFEADTSAPGAPVNIQIFDTSDRENQEYSIALKWSPPVSINEDNFDGYIIYRSDDDETFKEVASTSGSAYVDTELESRTYYYYVKSKDSTNNISIASTTVNIIPTGRYTTPPTLVTEPTHTVQAYEATIKWGTNRFASSFVEYGKSMSLGKTNGQVDSLTDHIVELTGLDAGSKYYYRAKYIDPDGNIGMSDILTFETLPPPTISEVEASDVGLDVATIFWTTNTSAKCTLHYGKGGSLSELIEETSSGSSHMIKLTGLDSTTDYSFQIDAIDDDLNEFSSDRYNFRTLEQPISSDLIVENKENVDIPTVIVKYNTTLPTNTLINFKMTSEASLHNFLDNEYVTEHSIELEGLAPSVEYEINVGGTAEDGVSATTLDTKIITKADSRPPGILSNRAVGRVIGRGKDARANLYIKVETDEITTAKVFYSPGIVLANFEQSSAEDPLNTYHLVTIPVDPGQVYSYIVKTFDESGNETSTKAVTVIVEDSKENATEIVVGTFADKFSWISKLWQ